MFLHTLRLSAALFLVAIWEAPARADAQLPAIFSDSMVLQRDMPIPVWGTANPGEAVTATLGDETIRTVASETGRWLVRFKPRPASERPGQLRIDATNSITFKDVLFGEVWLCSGQSNMHWPLNQSTGGREQAQSAPEGRLRLCNFRGFPYPNGRAFSADERPLCRPDRYLKGQWRTCSPESAAEFSAVAYFFGRELVEKLQIPVGLIHNAIGGTPTESWISQSSLKNDPQFQPLLKSWFTNGLVHSFCRSRARLNLGLSDEQLQESAEATEGRLHPYQPGFMHQAAIESIAPFAMRGVIWYQGESNAHDPQLHEKLFTKLIQDWRREWNQGEFPFFFVQLPNRDTAEGWAEFRESQRRALAIPATGMAVTIDIGDPSDVHPREKKEVGHRLALLARNLAYGEKVECSGPVVKSARAQGAEVWLTFSHADQGLKIKGPGQLRGFELAGADGRFFPASAEIQKINTIRLTSQVLQPVTVRYSFSANPPSDLINAEGLPAGPFLIPIAF